jgi:hypothetical protein
MYAKPCRGANRFAFISERGAKQQRDQQPQADTRNVRGVAQIGKFFLNGLAELWLPHGISPLRFTPSRICPCYVKWASRILRLEECGLDSARTTL